MTRDGMLRKEITEKNFLQYLLFGINLPFDSCYNAHKRINKCFHFFLACHIGNVNKNRWVFLHVQGCVVNKVTKVTAKAKQ